MDSSPDLSLKLRRGSSDSRDSFYMDFAQGIDSDIEEVATTISGPKLSPSISSSSLSPQIPPPLPPPQHIHKKLNDEVITQMKPTSTSIVQSIDPLLLPSTSPSLLPPPPPPPPPLPSSSPITTAATTISTTPQSPSTFPPLLFPQSTSSSSSITSPPPPPSSLPLLLPSTSLVALDEGSFMDTESTKHMPSPSSISNAIVSPETLSHHSQSPTKSIKSRTQHVTIDEKKMPISISTHHQLIAALTTPTSTIQHTTPTSLPLSTGLGSRSQNASTSPGHLALLYHSSSHHHLMHPVLPVVRRPSRLPEPIFNIKPREIRASEALATTFSALYGKLLVVMGIAFPMAEVISTYIPPSFYEGFYLYLYIGSMVFLMFMYITLLWGRPKIESPSIKSANKHTTASSISDSMDESDTESIVSESNMKKKKNVPPPHTLRRSSAINTIGRSHYGSFYLRMGAVAFGIGSMIYSGLEFGQYFELERDTKCHNVMLALTPATRMAFIFIQMYFIFLNNEQMKVYRHKILARFGLMHMIGTNLSVWLNVLIQETKHEILTFYDPENRTLRISHRLGNKLALHPVVAGAVTNSGVHHVRLARGLKGPHHIFECRRTNIIGTLVQDASPFLFPCTIEYSLICAAILYVMWRAICRPPHEILVRMDSSGHTSCKRSPHHYSVDCARAHKGLFTGILILVLTIISLILFFVLISRPEFITLAVTEVTICELLLYATATIATLIGMIQVRNLQYDSMRSFELDDILLVGAQTGLFLYSTFTVIGGHFTMRKDTVLVLITALSSIVQTACQTMFILDASRRNAATPEHIRKKPGREIVTFLLVTNLAMWAISTLEKSRAESHPIQLNFYGLWAWTIITHVSMPLAIFYRFHSTVCLCEIWKRAYKMKPAYM